MGKQTKQELETQILKLNKTIDLYKSFIETQEHIITTYADLQDLHNQTVKHSFVKGYVFGSLLTAAIATVIALICTL